MNNLIRSRRPDYNLKFPLGNGKFILLPVSKIVYIKAEKYISEVYLIDYQREKVSIAMTIGELSSMLEDYCFFRNHRSILVNISFIESIDQTHHNSILLSNNQMLPIAKRRKEDLILFLGQLGIDIPIADQRANNWSKVPKFNINKIRPKILFKLWEIHTLLP